MKFILSAIRVAAALSIASPSMASSTHTVQSSNPPFIATVAAGKLVSINLQPAALKLDMNAANTIRSETGDFKPARYFFPNADVPQTVLSHLTGIYGYDRRRDAPIVSSGGDWVIAEFFPAGSHIPTARFQLLGRQVQRQEQLDRAGRTIGIVVVGWARPSAMDDDAPSDLAALDDHPAWIRVFKVLPGNRKQLVALAWRKQRFSTAPDTYDAPSDSDLAYGVPNGVVKWRSQAEFVRAQHIDLDARSLAGGQRASR
jgi:hypothetical protein